MVRTAPHMSKVIPSNSPLQDAQKEASGCSESISHLASRLLIRLIKIAADHVMRLTIIGMLKREPAAQPKPSEPQNLSLT
jgi:hypothetical protein